MEIQLQELIDRIKNDGVTAAEAEAAALMEAAQAKADQILADAKAQAEKIVADAKTENDRIVQSGENALRQAGRNLLLSFRESVEKELRAIIGENVTALYSSEAFAQLIIRAVESMAAHPDAENITLILNEQDRKELESTALAALKNKLSQGVVLQANDRFDGGFRIAINDGGAYYDYSAEAVTDMLAAYLSPKITALMKEAQ